LQPGHALFAAQATGTGTIRRCTGFARPSAHPAQGAISASAPGTVRPRQGPEKTEGAATDAAAPPVYQPDG